MPKVDGRWYFEEEITEAIRGHISPLNGLREVWADFVKQWGYDPTEYPALMDELEAACWEAASDTAYEVMREHGLVAPHDPKPTVDGPAGGERP